MLVKSLLRKPKQKFYISCKPTKVVKVTVVRPDLVVEKNGPKDVFVGVTGTKVGTRRH